MREQKTGPLLASSAALLGLTGDMLLRGTPWGVNAPLWTLLFGAAALALIRADGAPGFGQALFACAAALAAAAGLAWRDSGALNAIDVMLLLFFLGWITLRQRGIAVWATGITRAAAALLLSGIVSVGGMFAVFLADIPWRAMGPGTAARRVFTLLRGVAIALPLLIVFTVLLTSADAAFAAIITNLFDLDLPLIVQHVMTTIVLALLSGGVIRAALSGPELPETERPFFLHLAAAETNVAIGLVDALFAAFVIVQLRYFFGGAALVQLDPKLTYAEYARRGFFELVAVAAIVLPLLLAAEWVIDKSSPRALRTMRALALAQVLLVGVMLVSAYRRMQLYVERYGMTELRLYTTAFMFLLGALLAWFAATVLTGHRERFFAGAVASGMIVVLALHVLDPDDYIVRTNAALAAAGTRDFDAHYVNQLSADATPALLRTNPLEPCTASRLVRINDHWHDDWRTWNASRARAHALVAPQRARLETLAQQCHPNRPEH